MTRNEATELAKTLLRQYGPSEFEVSLGDQSDYELMERAFADLGCKTGPDGDLFILKVFARSPGI